MKLLLLNLNLFAAGGCAGISVVNALTGHPWLAGLNAGLAVINALMTVDDILVKRFPR